MFRLVLTASAFAGCSVAQAQVFEAFDAAGSRGVIDAFESTEDIAGAYNYSNSRYQGSSPAAGALIADAVNVFVVDTVEGFGFVTVFNNSAGSSGSFDGVVEYTSVETIRVEDDAGDNAWGVGDSGMMFDLGFSWSGSFTDGWASTLDASAEGNAATISASSISNVDVIVWHSADGSTIRSTDLLGGGFGVRVIPAPAGAAVLGVGAAFTSRRRRMRTR